MRSIICTHTLQKNKSDGDGGNGCVCVNAVVMVVSDMSFLSNEVKTRIKYTLLPIIFFTFWALEKIKRGPHTRFLFLNDKWKVFMITKS